MRAIPPGLQVRLRGYAVPPPNGVPDPPRSRDGAVRGRIAGSWRCASRWSGGSALAGKRRWSGTNQERIQLAASQRPTIPLKLNATDQGCSRLARRLFFMTGIRSYLAVLCALLLAAPAGGFAADPQQSQPGQPGASASPPLEETAPAKTGIVGKITNPYRSAGQPQNSLADSPRLESLLRAGNLYLSLQDTIALALENNLDIAIERYGPLLAEAALRKAEAGGLASGVSTSVLSGPSSATVSSSGTTAGTNNSAGAISSNASSSAVGASALSSSGPAIPSLDPTLSGALNWGHLTTPQSSAFTTGTNELIQSQNVGNFGIQQSFLTGTTVSLGLNNTVVNSNNPRSDFNPATTSSLTLSLSQHLLQGFGPGVNARQIRIAKNNREVSDITFKLQVETTVAAVMELYWDLVSFNESVQVARDALTAANRLLEDNRKQVEVGTLAQIEAVSYTHLRAHETV